MNNEQNDNFHKPVMVKEVIENLITNKNGIYIDCTFGGGGHSKKILENLDKNAKLIGFDQDNDVIKNAEMIDDSRFTFIKSNFKYICNFLDYLNIDYIDGVFADLGVSSYQIDTPNRGFSTRYNGDLDMRMNINNPKNAYDIINRYSEKDLIYIFENFGELHNSKKIAQIICKNRYYKKIKTTDDLKEILLTNIKIPISYRNRFLAQVFQALRIEVNDELTNLEVFLNKIVSKLKENGRIAILSYHSLEDRIVKNFAKNNKNLTSLFPKPLTPSKEEISSNSRSRSAKLRSYFLTTF